MYSAGRKTEIGEISPTRITIETDAGEIKGTSDNANFAVDGDLLTSSAINLPLEKESAWLKLQFSEEYFIHRAIIYNIFYQDWYIPDSKCLLDMYHYKMCVEKYDQIEVSIYLGDRKKKSCSELRLTYGLKQPDQIYTVNCNSRGNIVKVISKEDDVEIFEIVVTSTGKSKTKR